MALKCQRIYTHTPNPSPLQVVAQPLSSGACRGVLAIGAAPCPEPYGIDRGTTPAKKGMNVSSTSRLGPTRLGRLIECVLFLTVGDRTQEPSRATVGRGNDAWCDGAES